MAEHAQRSGVYTYRSGYVIGPPQGPLDPNHNEGVALGSNVYAELGSTRRFLMRNPTSAAHVLGKLITAVGEDNLLWGTESIWYGSPQDQIETFRVFRISKALRETHGYAELTPALKK